MPDLQQLFEESITFITANKKSAWPYKHYALLQTLVNIHKPKRILEAGTGLGLTAISMAKMNPKIVVDSIDIDPEIIEIAKTKADEFGVSSQINFLNGKFLDILPTLLNQYDMVFFDGYALGLTVYLELERLLKSGGIMITANLTLGGDHKKVLARFKNQQYFSSSFNFDDTAFGVKI